MEKISVRLEDNDLEYVKTLQGKNGASISDVLRDLIEQARQRNQTGLPDAPAGPAGTVELVHEVCRYTASLLTALVRKVATNQADAEQMIQKAITDAAQVSGPSSVQDTKEE